MLQRSKEGFVGLRADVHIDIPEAAIKEPRKAERSKDPGRRVSWSYICSMLNTRELLLTLLCNGNVRQYTLFFCELLISCYLEIVS